MNKKYKIAIIVSLMLILLLGTSYVLLLNSKKNVIEETNNQTIPNLPGKDLQGKESADDSALDAREITLRVDDVADISQIKKAYEEYVDQNLREFPYFEKDGMSEAFAPADKNANLVPLDKFLDSVGADVNPRIKSIAGISYYALFYCINEKKQKEYGIVLDLNDKDPAKTKSNFNGAGDAMTAWELYLLKDIHNILFPSDKLSETDISQSLSFKDGKYRYAEVNLPSGKNSINYKIVGDPLNLIIIATSQDCVTKTIELFEALD